MMMVGSLDSKKTLTSRAVAPRWSSGGCSAIGVKRYSFSGSQAPAWELLWLRSSASLLQCGFAPFGVCQAELGGQVRSQAGAWEPEKRRAVHADIRGPWTVLWMSSLKKMSYKSIIKIFYPKNKCNIGKNYK
jgi:hypothetical protein